MEESQAAPDRDRKSEMSQKEAVQTCVVSTRPKLEFLHQDYEKHTFLSILDKTFHMCRDQKLCIQDFHIEFRTNDPETLAFLKEWFPFIVATMSGVETFHISLFDSPTPGYFDLPSEFIENSKSLQELSLCGFRFSENLPMDKVHHLKHLKTLSLAFVHIVDETFQNIMSSCENIEHLVLWCCEGLTTIRLMQKTCLKNLELCSSEEYIINLKEDVCLVDVPNLESMSITSCDNWFSSIDSKMCQFPALKFLHLTDLQLPSLDILSCDFPCLQHLKITDCRGSGQLRVSNLSLEHLTISWLDKSMKVVVDAPNLVQLDYEWSLPMDISFATTSNECTSNIRPSFDDLHSEDGFQRLNKLLEAVSQSKIVLQLPDEDDSDEDDSDNENHHEEDNDNENHEDANDKEENEEANENENHEDDNEYENHEEDRDYDYDGSGDEHDNDYYDHDKPVPVEYFHFIH